MSKILQLSISLWEPVKNLFVNTLIYCYIYIYYTSCQARSRQLIIYLKTISESFKKNNLTDIDK